MTAAVQSTTGTVYISYSACLFKAQTATHQWILMTMPKRIEQNRI